MTARPHLPRYFPGYDIYVWLGADCWVQDWQTTEILTASARERQFAIVAETHRSYGGFFRTGPFFDVIYNSYEKCCGAQVARKMIHFPYFNAGVFAGVPGAPHWSAWNRHLDNILRRLGKFSFFADQTAINVAIREESLPIAVLPAHYNWMCNRAMPALALDGRTLVEPDPPYLRIGILHMTANTKGGTWPIVDLRGNTHKMSLAHPPLDT
jgi:hypothetical protein